MSGFRDVVGLGAAALGSIGPTTPEGHQVQQQMIEALGQGWFLQALQPTVEQNFVVADCIDGRVMVKGREAPRAAGGSLALCVAAIAGGQADSVGTVVKALVARGVPLGVHQDCGANEALGDLARTLVSHGPEIDAIREDCGLESNQPTRDAWATRLETLAVTTTPAARLGEFSSVKVKPVKPEGAHAELVACLNWQFGTTLDRRAIRDHFGAQVFCIDGWALTTSIGLLAEALQIADRTICRQLLDFSLDLSLAAILRLGNRYLRVLTNDA